MNGFGSAVNILADSVSRVTLLRLRLGLSGSTKMVRLVSQSEGEVSAERLLGWFTLDRDTKSAGRLASVVESGHVSWCVAPAVSLELDKVGVEPLSEGPNDATWLFHFTCAKQTGSLTRSLMRWLHHYLPYLLRLIN